jgi:molybdenum cofactor cytidylyltransferase
MTGAVILAAGRSRRMGTQKVLLPFRGTTVIEHIVDQLMASSIDGVYAVIGHEGNRVRDALGGYPVSLVENPDPDADMLSSVRRGVAALPEACQAFLVVLGDQPRITAALVDDLLRARASSAKGIVVPVHDGKRGHPLLVSAGYRSEINQHHDGVGLRGLLHAHPDDVHELSVSEAWVLSDMNSPEEYEKERNEAEA